MFVYTIKDIVGLVLLAAVVCLFLFCGFVNLVNFVAEKISNWREKRRKARKENTNDPD